MSDLFVMVLWPMSRRSDEYVGFEVDVGLWC
jgi:hypothetical protein